MFGFGSASTDTRRFVPHEITRPFDRATAIAVLKTKVAGKSKTASFASELSVADLEAVKARLQAGKGYDGIPELSGPDALERVKALDAYLGNPKLTPSGEGTIPDFLIDALWSEPHREAAKLIANKFGRIPAKETILDNGALKHAVALLDNPAELARAFQDGGKKLYAGNLNDFMDRIRDLREFMATGTNGLANHGPIYIDGEVFHCVVPLPEVRGIPRPAANRPEDERAQQFEDMFNKMIAHYEAGFRETGYDRVYVRSDGATPEESRLFVAVRDRGTMKNIEKNKRASFVAKSTDSPTVAALSAAGDRSLTGEVGEIRLTGKVLWKADVPNNRRESATMFLRNLFRSSIRKHQEKYNPAPTLPGLAPTGGNPGVAGPGGPAPFVGGAGARGLAPSYYPGGVLGAGTTVLGLSAFTGAMAATTFFTVQQMLSGALVTGIVSLAALAGTVLAFEYERATTPKSINPILNAAGLSVQGKNLIAEEF